MFAVLVAKLTAYPLASHLPLLAAAAASAGDTGSSTGGPSGGFIAQAIQFGFLGLVFIDIVGFQRFLVPRQQLNNVERAHADALRLKDELIASIRADNIELKNANKQLQELTQERLIPALVQATDVSRAYVAELARRNDRGPGGAHG